MKVPEKGCYLEGQAGLVTRLIMGTIRVSIWYFPKTGGPQYKTQDTTILTMGTPKKVPLILGNPHMGYRGYYPTYEVPPTLQVGA